MLKLKLISAGLGMAFLIIVIGWLAALAPVSLLILTFIAGIFVLSVLYPKICFILLVLLTPWSPALTGSMVAVSRGIVGFPISLYEVLAVAAWVAFLVRLPKFNKKDFPLVAIFNVLFVIWLMISAVIGVIGDADITRLLRNVILFSTLFPFAVFIRRGFINLSQSERVNYQLVVLIMGLTALFILSPLVGERYGGVIVTSQLQINRIDWWFNTFVFVYILCSILGERSMNALPRMSIAVISMFSILFSLGRSFWAAAFVVLVYLSLKYFKRNIWLMIIMPALSVFVLLHLGVAEQRFIIGDASLQYRFYEHSIILSEVFSGGFIALIMGRGLAAPIPAELAQHFLAEYVWWIHNEWLLVLYNGGLIGVLLYALFLTTLTVKTKDCLGARLVGLALFVTSIAAGQLLNPISGPWIALASYYYFANNRHATTHNG